MKKRNQASKNNGKTTKKGGQRAKRTRRIKVPMHPTLKRSVIKAASREKMSVSNFVETAIREVLPAVQKTLQARRARRIHTGSLVWDESEFEAAHKSGRFVIVDLTRAQWAKLSKTPSFTFMDFLPMALNRQLVALQGAAPLYWTVFQSSRPAQITALRGPGPRGRDSRWRKMLRAMIRVELAVRQGKV
jgi:hypothetical protein